jgi:hypothetical protein
LGPLALAACSGTGDDTAGVASLEGEVAAAEAGADSKTADDAAPTLEETEARMLEFASCMRAEGIDIGDPVVDADGNVTFGGFGPGARGGDPDGGGPPEGIRAAFDSCGGLLDGLQLGGRRGDIDQTELQDTLLEFAQCMRDEGADMDDPDFSNFGQPGEGGGPAAGGGPFGALDRDDPAVQAATDVCDDLLAGIGRGPGAGAPPAGGGA